MKTLNQHRGKGMADMYSWSFKRYKHFYTNFFKYNFLVDIYAVYSFKILYMKTGTTKTVTYGRMCPKTT